MYVSKGVIIHERDTVVSLGVLNKGKRNEIKKIKREQNNRMSILLGL